MMRKRQTIGVALAAVLVALACGDGVRLAGDAMVDAGETLMDAGRELLDAGDAITSDAQAQPRVIEATCEAHIVAQTIERSSGDVIGEGTQYYAEVTVAGLSPDTVRAASVVLCDREIIGVTPATCPPEYICNATPVAPLRCTVATPQIEEGRARVYCGHRSQGPGTLLGERWRSARFIIE